MFGKRGGGRGARRAGSWRPTMSGSPSLCAGSAGRGGWLAEEIINTLRGEEPMMDPSVIDAVAGPLLADPAVQVATAAVVREDPEEFLRPSVVTVVVAERGDALYLSRAPIPHFRDAG